MISTGSRNNIHNRMLEIALFMIAGVVGYYIFIRKDPLSKIPGPKGVPILGNVPQLSNNKPFLTFAELAKKHGGIYKLKVPGSAMVIVTAPDLVYEMFVTKGAEFAGRPLSFRSYVFSEGQSAVALTDAGPAQKARRKLLHGYIRQYGSGIQRIEEITQSAVADMIGSIKKQSGKPIEVEWNIRRCITDIMGILVTGDTLTEEDFQDVITFLDLTGKAFEIGGDGQMLDMFPFLRFFGNNTYKYLTKAIEIERSVVSKWMKMDLQNGYIAHMGAMSAAEQSKFHILEIKEKFGTVADFFGGGVMTTTATLTNLVYILAHRPDVQHKLQEEVQTVVGESRPVSIEDKGNMPYHQATILETGRYVSVSPLGIPHKAVQASSIGGYTIPAGTNVFANLWGMHHDDNIWDQPFEFVPERYLDDAGQLVPADHPNRRHLMPFGAGTRVCVAEVLAQTRLFLILSRLMQEFTILPETEIDVPSIDPRNMVSGLMLNYPRYKVQMAERA